ncbi:uncharacterized protein LOC112183577 [Rosa chinensis]|uniref:uncharacterized protein LOC112183577 n=1 Tax=Rosa chinensis TaxID=74649 RepID=UPI000D096D5B|nr:uncharacterized protein LOC112183577 [Rosa chinensis]
MSKEILGSVIHCKNARGTTSVTSFFTKLKELWDEKDSLCGFLACTCNTATEVKCYMETQKTMKFLMGLNESYATIRSNIIGLDPLPTVNKAYAMALRHEKQADPIAKQLHQLRHLHSLLRSLVELLIMLIVM